MTDVALPVQWGFAVSSLALCSLGAILVVGPIEASWMEPFGGGLLSWSASTVLSPPPLPSRRRGETKTAFKPPSREASREKGLDLFHNLAVRRFRQRPWRHPLAPLEQVGEAGVLPVSQKRPDKQEQKWKGEADQYLSAYVTCRGHCIFVVSSWVVKVVALAVPCELYHYVWRHGRPLSPGRRRASVRPLAGWRGAADTQICRLKMAKIVESLVRPWGSGWSDPLVFSLN